MNIYAYALGYDWLACIFNVLFLCKVALIVISKIVKALD